MDIDRPKPFIWVMAKDEDTYPIDTVVRLQATGEFAIIKEKVFIMDGRNFLYYSGIIEGRGDGLWCLIHEEVDLECLPVQHS